MSGVSLENSMFEDLNNTLGILNVEHEIYNSRKAFSFTKFVHNSGVRNIRRRRDLTSDVCALHFQSQLLPLQVRILHTILQYIVTPKKEHSEEVTRMDVGLLDSLFKR